MNTLLKANLMLKNLLNSVNINNVKELVRLFDKRELEIVQLAQLLAAVRIFVVRFRRKEAQSLGPGIWNSNLTWTNSVNNLLNQLDDEIKNNVIAILNELHNKHVLELAKEELKNVIDWYDYELWLAKQKYNNDYILQIKNKIEQIKYNMNYFPIQTAISIENNS
jgi:hypothetical protein